MIGQTQPSPKFGMSALKILPWESLTCFFDGEQVKELNRKHLHRIWSDSSLLGLELAERLSVDIDILVNRKRKYLRTPRNL